MIAEGLVTQMGTNHNQVQHVLFVFRSGSWSFFYFFFIKGTTLTGRNMIYLVLLWALGKPHEVVHYGERLINKNS